MAGWGDEFRPHAAATHHASHHAVHSRGFPAEPPARPQGKARHACVLSIDGGGLRGILPATLLIELETNIQTKEGDPDARLADYFDLIVGTSTGGLLATMLGARGEDGRPKFSASDAMQLYIEEGGTIFPHSKGTMHNFLQKMEGMFLKPKYTAEPIEGVLRTKLEDLTLLDVCAPVLITTYDIYRDTPYLFSTFKAKDNPGENYYLRDACRATSAAPTYLPPAHIFSVGMEPPDPGEELTKGLTCIDGGVIANNPAMVGLTHLISYPVKLGNQDNNGEEAAFEGFNDVLLLSLGTGVQQTPLTENSKNWSEISMLPTLIDVFYDGAMDLVDYEISTIFGSLKCPANYLRIQVDKLPEKTGQMDLSTPENLANLQTLGKQMLAAKAQMRVRDGTPGLHKGTFKPLEYTNKDALDRFADWLIAEKRARPTEVY